MLFLILVVFLCTLGCAWLLIRSRQERLAQRELVARVRRSELYGHLYPELLRAGSRAVETVTIRPEAMAIRFLRPTGDTHVCTFESLGFDPMEQEPLYALAQAVAVDLPCLRDPDAYLFVTRQEHHPDGTPWCWYQYAIQTDYKDELLRALAQNDPIEPY